MEVSERGRQAGTAPGPGGHLLTQTHADTRRCLPFLPGTAQHGRQAGGSCPITEGQTGSKRGRDSLKPQSTESVFRLGVSQFQALPAALSPSASSSSWQKGPWEGHGEEAQGLLVLSQGQCPSPLCPHAKTGCVHPVR